VLNSGDSVDKNTIIVAQNGDFTDEISDILEKR